MSNQRQNSALAEDEMVSNRTMEDLPPEMLMLLLKYVMDWDGVYKYRTRKSFLTYRLVNSQWKGIIDSLLETRFVSGLMEPFPELCFLNVDGERRGSYQNPAYLCSNQELLHSNFNLLPFNGLFVNGHSSDPGFLAQEKIIISLPHFMATSCGTLTSFALHDQDINLSTLDAILCSTPFLKLLSLSDVRLSNSDVDKLDPVLPPPPKLPNLKTLQLKSGRGSINTTLESTLISCWLLAAYADQLQSLCVDSYYGFPALQQRHSYSISIGNKTFSTVTTSDSAFGQLKELKVGNFRREFLQQSTTLALQSLYLIELREYSSFDIRDVTSFIDKCGGNLKKLWLEVDWNNLLGVAGIPIAMDRGKLLPTANVILRKLRTLAIICPKFGNMIILRNTFLVKFPALEKLQLLYFDRQERERDDRTEEESEVDPEDDDYNDDRPSLQREQAAIKEARDAARSRLFEDIAVRHPGTKLEEAMVQDGVEQYGFWKVCKELKQVSIKFKKGDGCVVWRPTEI